ncbi:MAG TPA: zinc ribbon domain-containing protein [Pyrinomonadaceae bacterium]|nr:zinc ribbon domain-containing protein [Pyrinomonadaceae bacterium]
MFCSKCGTQLNDKLNYCNICGGKLTSDADNSHKAVLTSLIISLTAVSIIGLGSVIGLIAMLLNKGVKDELIVMLVSGYLLTLFSIAFLIARQISKIITPQTNKAESLNQVFQPAQLSAPTTAQLEEPRQQTFSVTDNTTRTFDEVFVKRN